MNTRQNPSEYLTRDIYQAVILKLSGIPIVRCVNQAGRGVFVFKDSPKIEGLISSYLNDELTMNPKALFECWKSLKSIAFSMANNIK